MKEIKIFIIKSDEREECEFQLGKLVNEGWIVVCGAGGSGQNDPKGFVVLQRERD